MPASEDDVFEPSTLVKPDIFQNLNIDDLIAGKGQSFDFGPNDEVDYEASLASHDRYDDAAYEASLIDDLQLASKTFSEWAQNMVKVDSEGLVKKMIFKEGKMPLADRKGKVLINYDLFLEGEEKPFDSCRVSLRSPKYLPVIEFVYGLAKAIESMKTKEKALFFISWKVAFGKLGCGNIPPEANILAVMEIVEVLPFCSRPTISQIYDDDFNSKLLQIKLLQNEGRTAFAKNDLERSLIKFKKGLSIIKSTSGASLDERTELKQLLLTFHVNLAVVYNKLEKPRKALIHCDEALTLDEKSAKAIYHRGRAFLKMNDFTKAANELLRGQQLFPNNKEFGKELETLEDRRKLDVAEQMAKTLST